MKSPDYSRAGGGPVVRAADAELLAGGSIGLLAQSGGVASNRALLRDGSPGVPPHFHKRSSEVFLVLAGAMEALVADSVVKLGAGDVLVVEPSVVHALAPAPGSDAEIFVVTTPPVERFEYYRLLDRIQRGDADAGQLMASQERFDSYFVESASWRDRHAGDAAGS
jgi:mannose-6-phosphate isomerase-like protein (cupin superfamily)